MSNPPINQFYVNNGQFKYNTPTAGQELTINGRGVSSVDGNNNFSFNSTGFIYNSGTAVPWVNVKNKIEALTSIATPPNATTLKVENKLLISNNPATTSTNTLTPSSAAITDGTNTLTTDATGITSIGILNLNSNTVINTNCSITVKNASFPLIASSVNYNYFQNLDNTVGALKNSLLSASNFTLTDTTGAKSNSQSANNIQLANNTGSGVLGTRSILDADGLVCYNKADNNLFSTYAIDYLRFRTSTNNTLIQSTGITAQNDFILSVDGTKNLNIGNSAVNTNVNISTQANKSVITNIGNGNNNTLTGGTSINNGTTNLSNTNIHNGANSVGQVNIATGSGSTTAITIGNDTTTNTTTLIKGNTTINALTASLSTTSTAVLQTPLNNSTKVANTQYVDTAISVIPTKTLTQILSAGNSAGTFSINMNNQNITGVNNIALTTINGASYPPATITPTLQQVITQNNNLQSTAPTTNQIIKYNGTNVIWSDSPSTATPTFSAVLAAGNSAGTNSLNMNNQNITGVNNIALTTINGAAYPPTSTAPTLTSVLTNNNTASNLAINLNDGSTFSSVSLTNSGFITETAELTEWDSVKDTVYNSQFIKTPTDASLLVQSAITINNVLYPANEKYIKMGVDTATGNVSNIMTDGSNLIAIYPNQINITDVATASLNSLYSNTGLTFTDDDASSQLTTSQLVLTNTGGTINTTFDTNKITLENNVGALKYITIDNTTTNPTIHLDDTSNITDINNTQIKINDSSLNGITLTKTGLTSNADLNLSTIGTKNLNIGGSTSTIVNIATEASRSAILHLGDGNNNTATGGTHINNGTTNLSNTNIHNGANSVGQINIGTGSNSTTAITIGNETTSNTTNIIRGNTTITKLFNDAFQSTTALLGGVSNIYTTKTTGGSINIGSSVSTTTLNGTTTASLGSSTATTQPASTNNTTIATTNYCDRAINNASSSYATLIGNNTFTGTTNTFQKSVLFSDPAVANKTNSIKSTDMIIDTNTTSSILGNLSTLNGDKVEFKQKSSSDTSNLTFSDLTIKNLSNTINSVLNRSSLILTGTAGIVNYGLNSISANLNYAISTTGSGTLSLTSAGAFSITSSGTAALSSVDNFAIQQGSTKSLNIGNSSSGVNNLLGSTNASLSATSTATTQAVLTNNTTIATTNYCDRAVSNATGNFATKDGQNTFINVLPQIFTNGGISLNDIIASGVDTIQNIFTTKTTGTINLGTGSGTQNINIGSTNAASTITSNSKLTSTGLITATGGLTIGGSNNITLGNGLVSPTASQLGFVGYSKNTTQGYFTVGMPTSVGGNTPYMYGVATLPPGIYMFSVYFAPGICTFARIVFLTGTSKVADPSATGTGGTTEATFGSVTPGNGGNGVITLVNGSPTANGEFTSFGMGPITSARPNIGVSIAIAGSGTFITGVYSFQYMKIG